MCAILNIKSLPLLAKRASQDSGLTFSRFKVIDLFFGDLMKARILIKLKQDILDSAGEAIQNSLSSIGFQDISNVRVGKVIDVDFADGDGEKN